jgi:hypothetical protein
LSIIALNNSVRVPGLKHLPAESAGAKNYFSTGALEVPMAKKDKKKSKTSSKKKMGRFKAGYKAVMTDRVRILLASLAVIAFAIVVIVFVYL